MADKGVRITFDTNEPTAQQFQEVFSMKGKFGKLIFAAEDEKITKEDLNIPEVKQEGDNKSPSQRLRDRMFVYYNNKNKTGTGFNTWYEEAMNEIGQKYLAKV